MFSRFGRTAILAVIVILVQTNYIHCDDTPATEEVDHVLVLTNTTFDDAVKDNKYLLVKFVAPWCGHCKSLTPAYAEAAKKLAEAGSEIKLATVDATIERDLASKYQVQGYPTIKFFREGVVTDYTGGRSESEIVSWLKKKTGPPADELTTVSELNKWKDLEEVVVVGAFKNNETDAAKAFLEVAKTTDGIPFGITTDEAVLKELAVTEDTIVLFKKFDEGRNDLTSSIDETTIREFIQANQLPIVVDFSFQTAQKVFEGRIKTHCLLFANHENDDYAQFREDFQTSAKDFRGKVIFVSVNTGVAENSRLLEFFGVTEAEIPTVRLIKMGDEITKYKPDSTEIKPAVLNEFINAVFDGKLKPHLRSQDVPEDWDAKPVKVLVGKNFDEVARDRSKTVLVAFVASWCGHCKQLTPIYEELGENYRNNSEVLIAKVDGTANEVEGVQVQGFPTIKLFPKNSDETIDYNGARTVAALTKFIDSDGKETGVDDVPVDETDEVLTPPEESEKEVEKEAEVQVEEEEEKPERTEL